MRAEVAGADATVLMRRIRPLRISRKSACLVLESIQLACARVCRSRIGGRQWRGATAQGFSVPAAPAPAAGACAASLRSVPTPRPPLRRFQTRPRKDSDEDSDGG